MARPRAETKSKDSRRKRPELPRAEPIRSWSTLFGSEPQKPGADASGARAAVGSVQRGVELGYRVIDEYIKQGAGFAAPFTASGQGAPSSTPWGPVTPERMLQYASDFTSVWFDAMSTMMSGRAAARAGGADERTPSPTAPQPARAASTSSSSRVASPVRVQIELTTRQSVSVSLTLDESLASSSQVSVEPLQSPRGKSSIGGVSIGPSDGSSAVEIKLTVPDGTASGRYSGAIVDSVTKNPQGRLTVIVAP